MIGYGTPVAYANAANNLLLRSYIQAKIDEENNKEAEDDPFGDDEFFSDFEDDSDDFFKDTKKPPLKDPSEYGISVWTHPMNLTTAQTAKQGGQVSNFIMHQTVIVLYSKPLLYNN